MSCSQAVGLTCEHVAACRLPVGCLQAAGAPFGAGSPGLPAQEAGQGGPQRHQLWRTLRRAGGGETRCTRTKSVACVVGQKKPARSRSKWRTVTLWASLHIGPCTGVRQALRGGLSRSRSLQPQGSALRHVLRRTATSQRRTRTSFSGIWFLSHTEGPAHARRRQRAHPGPLKCRSALSCRGG